MNSVDVKALAGLFPLCYMTHEELALLLEQYEVFKGKKGKCLVESGNSDKKALFMLSGKVELAALDGSKSVIEDHMQQAKSPISYANPHKYTVKCLSTVEFMRIDNFIIENLLDRHDHQNAHELKPSFDDEIQNNRLFRAIYKDLMKDSLIIPTLPKIAMSVRKAIAEEVAVRKIEILLRADPALAAMLVKTANSALFRSRKTVSTIEQAIIRLGMKTLRSLVTSYAVKNLFESKSKSLQKRMNMLWVHTTEVAAVSFVLARTLGGFDAEKALLIGLLHNVGVLPILGYADRYPEVVDDDVVLGETIDKLSDIIGETMLGKWGFDDDFVNAVRGASDWLRESSVDTDYCDLVMVAKRHVYIGKNSALPALSDMPAFHKLGLKSDVPARGISVLADANEQISEVRQLLS